MTIAIGDRLPELKLTVVTQDGAHETTTTALFGGKKAVLFAVPGAFTPTCSEQHLPGFLAHAAEFKARGIDSIVCLAVNDVFVMRAWSRAAAVDDRITMLADGSGIFTHALGLELDLVARGLGVRAQRFAMILEDGVVTHLAIEPPGGYGVSTAEQILAAA